MVGEKKHQWAVSDLIILESSQRKIHKRKHRCIPIKLYLQKKEGRQHLALRLQFVKA